MEPSDSKRLKLTVHYDGSAFHGWQFQPDRRTVQGSLQACLSRLADRPRTAHGSGRTDAGVHATGQVVSVDMPARWDARELRRALNAILPRDIWIACALEVGPRFHPRYDAIARTYRYDIGLDPSAASPFHRRWCWPVSESIDTAMLAATAEHLVGTHSFLAFSKSGQPERGELCSVTGAAWTPWELGVRFQITANRYLHHMVRYLVGTMIEIGCGRRAADDLPALLAGASRLRTSPPAPPEGLFLTHVEYPVDSLPTRPQRPNIRDPQ